MDDFLEFYNSRYEYLVRALDEAGFAATIERASLGCYTMLVRATDPEVGEQVVEVTSAAGPLPADPVDVRTWTLTHPGGPTATVVAAADGLDALTWALRTLLH